MGNCNFRSDSQETHGTVTSGAFKLNYPIGKGGFGKVWKVEHKKSKNFYALKEMEKIRIINKRSVQSVMNERRLLALIRHPFIVNMHFAYQDREKLYLVMDYLSGGDLRYHIGRQKRFTEDQTRFFISCILCSLEYLHENAIIHRDIKPENLVLDNKGFAHLTDFGIARIWQPENKHETSGTPGYMAPEVICRMNHTTVSDYFAVGVIVYEFMLGKRPYTGKTRRDIRDAMLAKQVQVSPADLPSGWNLSVCDFINRLLQRKPQKRLGFTGIQEILKHAWLKPVDFHEIYNKNCSSPYIPGNRDNFDQRQVSSGWNDEGEQVDLQLITVQNLFVGYHYDAAMQGDAAKDN